MGLLGLNELLGLGVPYSETTARFESEAEFMSGTRVRVERLLDTSANAPPPQRTPRGAPPTRESRQAATDALQGIRPGQRRAAARALLRSLRRAGATTPGGYARWLDSIGPDGRKWLDILDPHGGGKGPPVDLDSGGSPAPGRYAYAIRDYATPVEGHTGVPVYKRRYDIGFTPVAIRGVRTGARVGVSTRRQTGPTPTIRVRLPGGQVVIRRRPTGEPARRPVRPSPTPARRAPVFRWGGEGPAPGSGGTYEGDDDYDPFADVNTSVSRSDFIAQLQARTRIQQRGGVAAGGGFWQATPAPAGTLLAGIGRVGGIGGLGALGG